MTYICPKCGIESEGINHNNRGLRCPACWAKYPPGLEPVVTETELVGFVTETQAAALALVGIRTMTDVIEASVETLMEADGIGPVTATKMKREAGA